MRSQHSFCFVPVALCLVLLLGCGGYDYGPTGKVSGTLTINGKPPAAGTAVSFMQMEKGFLAFGLTDAEGNFEVKSWNNGAMPVGKYKVMLAPPAGEAPLPQNVSAEEAFENPELLEPQVKAEFPVKYRDTSTSGLEYDVEAGNNTFPIDLKF